MTNYADGLPVFQTAGGPRRCGVEANRPAPAFRRSGVPAVPREDWRPFDLFERCGMPPAPDQGPYGSTAGYAVAYACELLRRLDGGDPIVPSGAYAYALANGQRDLGCDLWDALARTLAKGLRRADDVAPNQIMLPRIPMGGEVQIPGGVGLACLGFDEVVSAMCHGMPVVLAFAIGNEFGRTGADGVPPQPAATTGLMAAAAGGLRRVGDEWQVQALVPWGPAFGAGGYVYLTESRLARPAAAYAVTTEAAVARFAPRPEPRLKAVAPPPPPPPEEPPADFAEGLTETASYLQDLADTHVAALMAREDARVLAAINAPTEPAPGAAAEPEAPAAPHGAAVAGKIEQVKTEAATAARPPGQPRKDHRGKK